MKKNQKKILFLLFLLLILLIFILQNCEQEDSLQDINIVDFNEEDEITIPNGFQELIFGMNLDEIKNEMKKHSINLSKTNNDGWEIVTFIQNTSENDILIQKLSLFIFSDKFSPDNPISNYLPNITIYNINMNAETSWGIMNHNWIPVEIYFYKDKFFGISAGFFENVEGENISKEQIINIYKSGRKKEGDRFNTIIEDDKTFVKINVADNLYIYDKKIYIKMLAYVNTQLN